MSRIPDQSKRTLWSQRFYRFRKSGLSVARFCSQENIPAHSFYYWAKRLGDRSQHRQSPAVDLAVRQRSQPATDSGDGSQQLSSVMIHCNERLRLAVPAHCIDAIRAILQEFLRIGPDGDGCRSVTLQASTGFQQVIVRPQLQSQRA